MEPNTHTNTHTHTLQLLDKVDLHTWSCGSANDIMSRHRLDDEGPRLLKEVSFSTEQVCLDCNVIADREVTDTERWGGRHVIHTSQSRLEEAFSLLIQISHKMVEYLSMTWASSDTFAHPQEWIHRWHNKSDQVLHSAMLMLCITQKEGPRAGISICLFLCLSGRLSGFVWRPEGKTNKMKSVRPLSRFDLATVARQVNAQVCHKFRHLWQQRSEGWRRMAWIIQTSSVISLPNDFSIMHFNGLRL